MAHLELISARGVMSRQRFILWARDARLARCQLRLRCCPSFEEFLHLCQQSVQHICVDLVATFKKLYLHIFRERGREGEKERNMDQLTLARPQPGTWPPNQELGLPPRPVP